MHPLARALRSHPARAANRPEVVSNTIRPGDAIPQSAALVDDAMLQAKVRADRWRAAWSIATAPDRLGGLLAEHCQVIFQAVGA